MLYSIDEIRQIHIEISSLCNAECPLCPRNLYGYPYNDGYVERNLTLDEVKKIFLPGFLTQLTDILINGNFGDIVMNPEAVEIIKYFREHNPYCRIDISTNGGARNQEFWASLAKLGCRVYFCLDGLEDTHHLYRKNTRYDVVLNNAKSLIAAGGRAVWKMVMFDHNRHQIDTARELSKTLGFEEFCLIDHGRNNGPVFDNQGNLLHTIGKPTQTNFQEIFKSVTQGTEKFKLENSFPKNKTFFPIQCEVKKSRSVYISSEGDVYPCCYVGFSPRTYSRKPFKIARFYQGGNAQLSAIIEKNNALIHSLEECIQWFNKVEETWDKPNFESGRLLICDYQCGKEK